MYVLCQLLKQAEPYGSTRKHLCTIQRYEGNHKNLRISSRQKFWDNFARKRQSDQFLIPRLAASRYELNTRGKMAILARNLLI